MSVRYKGSTLDGGKRRDILDAAHELFGAVGYDKTGIREIADRANVALGTVYAHFGRGKADILRVVLDERIDKIVSYALATPIEDPVDGFLDMVRRLNDRLVHDPLMRRLLTDQENGMTERRLRERGREIEELLHSIGANRLRELDELGLVRCPDPGAVITLLRASSQGWMQLEGHIAQASHERMLDTLISAVKALIKVD